MANKNVHHKLANYLFYREHAHVVRNGSAIPFDKANSIGILYESTSKVNYKLVKEMVSEFRSLHKDVFALGYYNSRQLPKTRLIKLGLDYFTKKSLNWKLKPNCTAVTNFINNKFDILICLNIERNIPLKHIASMSRAKFKIGRYDENHTYLYDLMISVNDSTDLKSYIEQTKYYLNQVKDEAKQNA